MATLKKRRAKWYARVRWYDKYGKRVEKQIPLHTTRETVAIERLVQIEKKEKYSKFTNTYQICCIALLNSWHQGEFKKGKI